MRGSDVIRSNSGTAYIKVDGKVEEMFYVKSIEATIEKKKTEVPVLGKRMVSHKTGQLKGKGKMTIYYVTPMFRKMTESFKNTGRDTFFDICIGNEDEESDAGEASVMLYGCNIDSVLLAKLDASDEVIDEEVSFTFDDYEHLSHFNDTLR